jgi:hypothetical protein
VVNTTSLKKNSSLKKIKYGKVTKPISKGKKNLVVKSHHIRTKILFFNNLSELQKKVACKLIFNKKNINANGKSNLKLKLETISVCNIESERDNILSGLKTHQLIHAPSGGGVGGGAD